MDNPIVSNNPWFTAENFNVNFNATSLEFSGKPTYEQWKACGSFIRSAERSVMFWIGDWLNYGEHKYGETYTQAMSELGYEYDTLARAKYVSSRVPFLRRRQNLSFEHHKCIADLDEDEQNILLDKAEQDHLPVQEFRRVVRKQKLMWELPENNNIESLTASNEDYQAVDPIIDLGLRFIEQAERLQFDLLPPHVRDYTMALLRKFVGKVGRIVTIYEKTNKE